MQKRVQAGWFGLFQRTGRDGRSAQAGREAAGGERYPAHATIILPDGQLMRVRNASLTAAKDALAAQRAIERRLRAGMRAEMYELATQHAG